MQDMQEKVCKAGTLSDCDKSKTWMTSKVILTHIYHPKRI